MEELHLDPACDFVSVKSAESDGITSDVAYKHFCECEQCRSYHTLVANRQNTIEKLAAAKEREFQEKDKAQERLTTERRLLNEARLRIVAAHLGASSVPLFKLREIEHTPGLSNAVVSSVLVTGFMDFRITVRSDKPSTYEFRLTTWETYTQCDSVADLLSKIAEELARTRHRLRAKEKEEMNGKAHAERSS